jgi:hypothetical protein
MGFTNSLYIRPFPAQAHNGDNFYLMEDFHLIFAITRNFFSFQNIGIEECCKPTGARKKKSSFRKSFCPLYDAV